MVSSWGKGAAQKSRRWGSSFSGKARSFALRVPLAEARGAGSAPWDGAAAFSLGGADFRSSRKAPTMAASNVATLLASVVLGLALFAETLRPGPVGPALAVPGLLLMAGGILVLAVGGADTAPSAPEAVVLNGGAS